MTEVDMMDLQDTSEDIKLYLEYCLCKIAEKQRRAPYDGWLSEEQRGILLVKASNLFVWVSTVHKYLMSARNFEASMQNILNVKSETKEQFEGLYSLYNTVLEGADAGEYTENKKFIGHLLGFLFLTSRHSALPPTALAYLQDTHLENINCVLADLESVLLKDPHDNTIRVYHPSFLDYLEGNHHPSKFQYSEKELNAAIMNRCLKVLSRELKFNICWLETSHKANNEFEDLQRRIEVNVSPMLRYASLHWVDHLEDGKDEWSSDFQDSLKSFLHGPKIIYWIEVLTLFGMVTQAISIMEQLKVQDLVC